MITTQLSRSIVALLILATFLAPSASVVAETETGLTSNRTWDSTRGIRVTWGTGWHAIREYTTLSFVGDTLTLEPESGDGFLQMSVTEIDEPGQMLDMFWSLVEGVPVGSLECSEIDSDDTGDIPWWLGASENDLAFYLDVRLIGNVIIILDVLSDLETMDSLLARVTASIQIDGVPLVTGYTPDATGDAETTVKPGANPDGTYVSQTYPEVRFAFDPVVWEVVLDSDGGARDHDTLTIHHRESVRAGTLDVEIFRGYAGEPTTCLTDELADVVGTSNIHMLSDTQGEVIDGATTDRAWAAYAYADVQFGRLSTYVSCRVLDDPTVILVFTLISDREEFADIYAHVREIEESVTWTPVPETPAAVTTSGLYENAEYGFQVAYDDTYFTDGEAVEFLDARQLTAVDGTLTLITVSPGEHGDDQFDCLDREAAELATKGDRLEPVEWPDGSPMTAADDDGVVGAYAYVNLATETDAPIVLGCVMFPEGGRFVTFMTMSDWSTASDAFEQTAIMVEGTTFR